MNKINIVIYDYDIDYVEALVELLNKSYAKYVKVIGITEQEQLQKLQRSAYKMDILLINERLEHLTEGNRYSKVLITLSEGELVNDLERRKIFKYQNGQAIFNAIRKIYITINKDLAFDLDMDKAKLLGFFSPIGGIGTSTVSVGIASKLTKEGKKVLYITMEQIASLGVFFDTKSNNYNLSDLLYAADDEANITEKLLRSVINCDQNKIYYINPVNSTLDFEELNGQNFISIIRAIKDKLDFDYIIMDLGSRLDNLSNIILENCDKAMLLIGQGNLAILKAEETLKQFDRIDNITLIVNKYDRELGTISSEEFIKMRKPIYFTIPYDEDLKGQDMSIQLLNNTDNFLMSITELSHKLLREEW